jgi:hypothetical protein
VGNAVPPKWRENRPRERLIESIYSTVYVAENSCANCVVSAIILKAVKQTVLNHIGTKYLVRLILKNVQNYVLNLVADFYIKLNYLEYFH